jgi:hypothetical protein
VRARIILEQAEGQPFPTFDRIAMFDESAGKSLGDPLDAFAAAREANLAALSGLDITPEKLARKGDPSVAGHGHPGQPPGHLGQVVEVMAHQYDAAVGPWKTYLAILTRPVLTE